MAAAMALSRSSPPVWHSSSHHQTIMASSMAFLPSSSGRPSHGIFGELAKRRARKTASIVCMAPDEEKMTRRSPLDFPVEWDRPSPGRRPDIFPQFSPMKTPLPPPLPSDPPEEEEDEEEKKEEDPEKEPEKPEEQS